MSTQQQIIKPSDFQTIKDLSASDFGRVFQSKDGDGKFRSFGVRYGADTIWVNDEAWYKAWIAGEVIQKSITITQVQRVRNVTINGEIVRENGRAKTEIVTEEIAERDGITNWSWEITSLKTLAQLQGEASVLKQIEEMNDDQEVRKVTRTLDVRKRKLEAAAEYNKIAKIAAEQTELSDAQTKTLDEMLAKLG